jgi:hypothetical protein
MTVARLQTINGIVNAICGWFEGQKSKRATYPIEMLQHANPSD